MQELNRLHAEKVMLSDPTRLYLQVAKALTSFIQSNSLTIGTRLPAERDLASQYNVSRQTVREALIAMEVSGLIEIRPGSGVYILKTSGLKHSIIVEDAPGPLEIMEARMHFEGEAAYLAAKRISNEELLKLQWYIKEMEEHVVHKKPDEAEKFDRSFHQLIAESTRNSAISSTIKWLWELRDSSEISRVFSQKVRDNVSCTNALEHSNIVEYLIRRDGNGARQAMQKHLNSVSEAYIKLISS